MACMRAAGGYTITKMLSYQRRSRWHCRAARATRLAACRAWQMKVSDQALDLLASWTHSQNWLQAASTCMHQHTSQACRSMHAAIPNSNRAGWWEGLHLVWLDSWL